MNTLGIMQHIISATGSAYLRVSAANAYQVNGVTIPTHVVNTSENLIRLVLNGASSSMTINNGTPVTFNSGGTAQTGITLHVGASSSGTNYCSMDLKFLGLSTNLLTSPEVISVWTYFGL